MKFSFLSLLKAMTVVAVLVLIGCHSGYMPMTKSENEVYNGRGIRAIQNRNCIITIGLTDDGERINKFAVVFGFDPIKGTTPKISNIKVDLKNVSDQSKMFFLQTIHFRQGVVRVKDGQYRSILDSSSKKFIPLDLLSSNEGVTYIDGVSYDFVDTTIKSYPNKLQANFEVDIEEMGKIETVRDSVLFKRFHRLVLTH